MIDAVLAVDASPRGKTRAAATPSAGGDNDFASLIAPPPRVDAPEADTALADRRAETRPSRERSVEKRAEPSGAASAPTRPRASPAERPVQDGAPQETQAARDAPASAAGTADAPGEGDAPAGAERSADAANPATTPTDAAAAPVPAPPPPAPTGVVALLLAVDAAQGAAAQPAAEPAEAAPTAAVTTPAAIEGTAASPNAGASAAANGQAALIAAAAAAPVVAAGDGADPDDAAVTATAATTAALATQAKPRATPALEPGTPPPAANGAEMPGQAEGHTAKAAAALAAAPGQNRSGETEEPAADPLPEAPARGPTAAAVAASHVQAERAAVPSPATDPGAAATPVTAPAEAAMRPAGHAAPQGAPTTAGQVATREAVPIERVAFEIAATARAGVREIEIKLDPPELGRIDVTLDVDETGRVTTRLVVDKAETLSELRRDAQSLERALNGAGLKTDQGSLQFSLRDQGQGRENARQDQPTARGTLLVELSEANAWRTPDRARLAAAARGGVDVRI